MFTWLKGLFRRDKPEQKPKQELEPELEQPRPALIQIPPTPYWLKVTLGEMGTQEWPGTSSNPEVEKYYQAVESASGLRDDVPWCAAFMAWCFKQAGIDGPDSLLARSWLDWGKELPEPRLGCIIVLERGEPWQGHVGLFMGSLGIDWVYVLGGNQADQVNVRTYPTGRVLSYRWPLIDDWLARTYERQSTERS